MSIEDDLRRIYREHPDMIVADCMNVLLHEQADAIIALRSEVERLTEANAHLDAVADQSFVELERHISHLVELSAENEELREALADVLGNHTTAPATAATDARTIHYSGRSDGRTRRHAHRQKRSRPMTDDQFLTMLELRILADPWPFGNDYHETFMAMIDTEAQARGYADASEAWADALVTHPRCDIIECQAIARWLVLRERRESGDGTMAGSVPSDDALYACIDHVGVSLRYAPSTENPEQIYWTVVPVKQGNVAVRRCDDCYRENARWVAWAAEVADWGDHARSHEEMCDAARGVGGPSENGDTDE